MLMDRGNTPRRLDSLRSAFLTNSWITGEWRFSFLSLFSGFLKDINEFLSIFVSLLGSLVLILSILDSLLIMVQLDVLQFYSNITLFDPGLSDLTMNLLLRYNKLWLHTFNPSMCWDLLKPTLLVRNNFSAIDISNKF
jgi:hypothetical protein